MVDYPITQNVGLGSDGKFTGGDPSTGQSASRLSAAWMNAVTDELLNVVRAAGLNPDEMDNGQLLAAVRALTWSAFQIPLLDASKIDTGELNPDRIPPLDASKINSGAIKWDHYPVGYWTYWLDSSPPSPKWTIADGRQISRNNYPDFVTFAEPNELPMDYLSELRLELGNEQSGYIYIPKLTDFVRGGVTNIGLWKRDEIRNINGSFLGGHEKESFGAFYDSSNTGLTWPRGSAMRRVLFDASKVVPTGPENVPKHRILLPIIKIRA